MSESNNRILESAKAVRRGLTFVLKWVVVILMASLVLDVLGGVVSRYVFGQQAKWSEELARLLLVWVSLFGASVAFGMKAHLGLDYVAGKLHPEAKRFNAIVGALISLVFAVLVFGIGGWALVQKTMESGQTMSTLPIAKGWEYAALPVSGVFMVIFLVEQLVEAWLAPLDDTEEKEAA